MQPLALAAERLVAGQSIDHLRGRCLSSLWVRRNARKFLDLGISGASQNMCSLRSLVTVSHHSASWLIQCHDPLTLLCFVHQFLVLISFGGDCFRLVSIIRNSTTSTFCRPNPLLLATEFLALSLLSCGFVINYVIILYCSPWRISRRTNPLPRK